MDRLKNGGGNDKKLGEARLISRDEKKVVVWRVSILCNLLIERTNGRDTHFRVCPTLIGHLHERSEKRTVSVCDRQKLIIKRLERQSSVHSGSEKEAEKYPRLVRATRSLSFTSSPIQQA